MPDKKLTDNEIVKGLECCIGDTDGKDCFGCPLYEIDDCQAHLNLAALDLINRQKAEIERLKKGVKVGVDEICIFTNTLDNLLKEMEREQ